MHGCGNDFLILDYLHGDPPTFYDWEIAYLCDRHFGLGADGFVVLKTSPEAHAAWDFYNSDGSMAEMCGNAARCVIKYLVDKHYPLESPISLETRAGIIKGRKMEESSLVEVMLLPHKNVQLEYTQKVIKSGESAYEVYVVDTGVPHAVIDVKDIDSYPILEVGRKLHKHPAFGPAGTNVTFFQRLVGQKIRSSTFERGVEYETFACGTGVAAAAFVYSEVYLQPFPMQVSVPGGELIVDISPVSKVLLLQGPAEYVYTVEVQEFPRSFEKPHLFSNRRRS
jgi:diaminopimelate epimerase